MSLDAIGAALLRRLDPETAHGLAIRGLSAGLVRARRLPPDPRLAARLGDLVLPNPLGMAAGFDKNAVAPDGLLALGFGFVEVGTLTPRPQPGNPRPRIFRLPEAGAVINRLGFNNDGHAAALARLEARRGRGGVVGVNVGANKDSTDRPADYVAGIRAFAAVASYFTVNVSSPNTPGLRDLQARDALDELLARALAARDDMVAAVGRRVPVLLKIAPDLTEAGLDDVADVSLARGVDGLIVSNTTLSRVGVSGPVAGEAGGLSGRPLFERSTVVLAKMRRRVGRALPIVGVGGIADGADAVAKIRAGADLVQGYTGFIYAGPAYAADVLAGLSAALDRDGLPSPAALRDLDLDRWADRPIPA
ncbi:quinone-dependent dihydroorotate dehydrogenase [Oharaeibacter diazotrophicus]|uniref:Dihydroorotate dehydrogenase (quinone) n=2 Tax=Oharaeibacter diazotrophicus TaxID=1920512 RepID=A0A4R6R986_9HYPH|nr:quinone-dependent dihydroorotate dehydrogenase [Oharaeibacter diazotrophicus]TDP82539.1 dihydroorotate oxidase A [Oharaeibacter diazotrophicus]BBE72697.1 dihydroorotate dehydrogenase (quinone) [Pleomorphomonas sp. SM30]GLS76732.1 dihydroorotate dehydrogenase (quinone) [Oharaeibacter diazotrophicus]